MCGTTVRSGVEETLGSLLIVILQNYRIDY